MTIDQLYDKLDYVNHSRSRRMEMAALFMHNPMLLKALLEIAVQNNDPVSPRACWILEYGVRQDHRFLDPQLDFWAENLSEFQLESSIRPMAKICELLVLEYYQSNLVPNPSALEPAHIDLIATSCFDWLIGPHKVAPKAYSMTSLYHLGKDFDWIHPELCLILEKEYANGSAAYKARARQVLSKLRK